MSNPIENKMYTDPDLAGLISVMLRFERAQSELANFGADDTEPDGTWHYVLRSAAKGLPYPDFTTPNDWGLFTMMQGSKAAAMRLTAAARIAHEEILNWRESAPAGLWRKMEDFLEDYCWRMDW